MREKKQDKAVIKQQNQKILESNSENVALS